MSLINPSVSVIIPSFNHEKFVAEAIESVLNQSFTNFELIIIDDGSKDRSIGIIREFVKKDPRIKFFSQDNQGSHSAINKGISLSNGKYVAILNSDDRFHPDRLAILVDTIKEQQKKFLITAVNLIDQEGSIIEDESHWWRLARSGSLVPLLRPQKQNLAPGSTARNKGKRSWNSSASKKTSPSCAMR